MANRYMGSCSLSPILEKLKSKPENFTAVKMTMIMKTGQTKCCLGCGEKVSLMHCW